MNISTTSPPVDSLLIRGIEENGRVDMALEGRIAKSVESLRAIEKDMRKRMDFIDKLFGQRCKTIAFINKNSTALSPIRRLPAEMKLYIFRLATEHDRNSHPGRSLFRSTAVTLSHVNKEFRKILLSNPSFWTDISIFLPGYPVPHPSCWRVRDEKMTFGNGVYMEAIYARKIGILLEAAKTFVSRSGDRPLNLNFDAISMIQPLFRYFPLASVNGSRGLEGDAFNATQPLIDFILELWPRLKNVNLAFPLASARSNFTKLANVSPERAPRLRNLQLVLSLDFYLPSSHEFEDEDAGGECDIDVEELLEPSNSFWLNISLTPRVNLLKIPAKWAALTRLTISMSQRLVVQDDPESALEFVCSTLFILQSCEALQECGITVPSLWTQKPHQQYFSYPYSLPNPYISLPRLTSLAIQNVSQLPLSVASCLELPALENLTLGADYQNPTPFEPHESIVVRLISQFGSQLTTLTLHCIDLTQEGLYECLDRVPNVKTLRLMGEVELYEPEEQAQLTREVLQRMNGVTGNGFVCPMLQNFYLRPGLTGSNDLSNEALIEFIAARRRQVGQTDPLSCTPLESFKILFYEAWGVRPNLTQELHSRAREIDLECFSIVPLIASTCELPSFRMTAPDPDVNF